MNVEKTKEKVVDFRKGYSVTPPLIIEETVAERVNSSVPGSAHHR